MLTELKFVAGAIAKKNLVPAMQHFSIDKGRIRAYNGAMALCSPIQFDIDCKPNAVQLIKAMNKCDDNFPLVVTMTDGGRLRLVNGPYRAYVDCIQEETPHVEPEGEVVHFDGEKVRRAFELLEPLVGTDASRPFTNGIFLSGGSALATCNVIVAEYWLGCDLPFTINVPRDAVREVLRTGLTPTHAQLTSTSVTFHFENNKWIRSQLYEEWKVLDQLKSILGADHEPVPVNDKFFEGLNTIEGFINKQSEVFFRDGALHTTLHSEGAEASANYALEDFPYTGCYALPMVKLLEGIVEKIDWSSYPNPCIFYGAEGMLRGAIIGRRMAGDVSN